MFSGELFFESRLQDSQEKIASFQRLLSPVHIGLFQYLLANHAWIAVAFWFRIGLNF